MKAGSERLYLLIRKFLEVHLPARRGASANTVRSYKAAIAQFVDHLTDGLGRRAEDLTFDDFGEGEIAGFLDSLEARGLTVSTRNQRLAAIRAFLSFAAQEDVSCMAVLAAAQRVPKKKTVNRVIGYLSEEQLSALLSQPDQGSWRGRRDLLILAMLYDTAARASELVGLRLGGIHLRGSCPYVVLHGKGNKARSVPLMSGTVDLLAAFIAEHHAESTAADPLVFTLAHGERRSMSYENVSKIVAKYGESAAAECPGFPQRLHAHMLRHTRAMHLFQDGVPLSYVKEILGHSNINTTSIYASADLEMLRKAMAPLDVDLPTTLSIPSSKDEKERLMRLAGLR